MRNKCHRISIKDRCQDLCHKYLIRIQLSLQLESILRKPIVDGICSKSKKARRITKALCHLLNLFQTTGLTQVIAEWPNKDQSRHSKIQACPTRSEINYQLSNRNHNLQRQITTSMNQPILEINIVRSL